MGDRTDLEPDDLRARDRGGGDYDDAIARRLDRKLSTEELFFEIALEDILAAADLFRPVYEASGGPMGSCRWKFRRRSPTTPKAQ